MKAWEGGGKDAPGKTIKLGNGLPLDIVRQHVDKAGKLWLRGGIFRGRTQKLALAPRRPDLKTGKEIFIGSLCKESGNDQNLPSGRAGSSWL